MFDDSLEELEARRDGGIKNDAKLGLGSVPDVTRDADDPAREGHVEAESSKTPAATGEKMEY